MKITIEIAENELEDAMRFTRTNTVSQAIIAAVADFNRRNRMASLTKHAGTCDALITAEELQTQRRRN